MAWYRVMTSTVPYWNYGLFRIRIPYPFQWGAPTFDAGEAFAMMMASFVALVESTGAFMAVSRYASATPMPPSVLSRGVGWQGVAILLSGLFGTANGSSVSVENAGLLALTRVGSRRVVQIAAGIHDFLLHSWKIRGSLCFNSSTHFCRFILPFLCLRGCWWS
ncbi:XANTHINE-URACIL / VITAMIN C PERMEASE FAMILY MEMBER [Salix purpurea]|uniref:XANTHINE-URACIL / VITAMIN C PERMEASE FAMILY MEMBER n=1 Tax=Salix purpurea TaxID=77065 RepID=A0A9Q1A7F7_SALPP|nr:XANTHINE-URACIL / VITAMIN C PERMEASE FAMILY MEMBER [Salix purpurea]